MLTLDGQSAASGQQIAQGARAQALPRSPQLSQSAEEARQRRVLAAPGEGAPVQRILEALHAGLVAVEEGGRAGEAVEQHSRQTELCQAPGQFSGGEAVRRTLRLGFRCALRAQQRQNARCVVGAQEVHGAIEGEGRVVLTNCLHAVAEDRGVAAGQPVQQGRAEGVVHQAVDLAAQQVSAPLGVGDLVAAVLPDLTQQVSPGLFRVDGRADALDKVAGQLVGHIQPPAVRAAAQPMPDHAVLIAEDEVTVSRLRLIDGGQGLHAPPGVVVRRPRVEAVPAVIL